MFTSIFSHFICFECVPVFFSIFAVSMIQQSTPDHLLGKVMAYTSAITMCAQPVGQMVYGFLFDGCREAVYLVLIPTGVIVGMIGVGARGVREVEKGTFW